MGSEDLIFFQIKSKHKMLSVKLITLVLSMAMFSHGKAVQQCNSCCPTPTPPDEDAITCDKLGEHLDKLDDAIAEGSCDEVEGQQSDAVCNEFTKAIPPCMVLNGGVKQSECLAEKASELGDEEIVTNCKCKAFRNIRNTVGSVKNMMCVDSRESRNFGYGYGMNTIWFQYLLCKDLGFACYFFTQGWNQGDFGQYYLYDNLLDSSTGISDDTLLTLAVVGGLGGGYRPQYAPAHGHYYPPPPEPEPETEPEAEPETEPEHEPLPLHRRRRSSGIPSSGATSTEKPSSRRRRQTSSEEPSETPTSSRRRREASKATEKPTSSRRRCEASKETEKSTSSRRRREASKETEKPTSSRRRREVSKETEKPTSSRRRREASNETEKPATSRRRREASKETEKPTTSRRRREVSKETSEKSTSSRRRREASKETSEKPASTGTSSRRRRENCCDLNGSDVCEIDQVLCDD